MPIHLKSVTDPKLVDLLKAGRVGVLPSDTQYGLMALAQDAQAVERLHAIKPRDQKPGTFIAASIEQLVALGLKARYLKAVEQYWPNPISIIIPAGPELQALHRGTFGLAVRIPKDDELLRLLAQTGALATTSANAPGEPPAATLAEAEQYFGDAVDFYVDGGDLSGQPPSTVIRIIDDAIEVVRPGAVTINPETGAIIA